MRYKLVDTPKDMHERFGTQENNPTCHFCCCASGTNNICDQKQRSKLEELLGPYTTDSDSIKHFIRYISELPQNVRIL
jgi:hypothetical protein